MVLALLLAQSLQLHGLADVDYAYASQGGHQSFPYGAGTTAPRANEFDLNAAALELLLDPKPVGFHLTLAYGSGVDVLHASESRVFANVYEASVSWNIDALTLEAGVYPSHIGYEGFFSKDNWNYTRGWMGELSPYYQAGLKIAYAFDAHWSAQVHVLNGWQTIRPVNRAKSVGTQIAYASDKFSASFNTFAGPALPGDDSHWRLFGDLTAQLKVSDRLSLGATADAGRQDLATGAATWNAAGVYARFAFTAVVALAARAEYYDDADGFFSQTPQTLKEGTLTLELRPAERLILKFEGRHDALRSTSPSLAIASAVATF